MTKPPLTPGSRWIHRYGTPYTVLYLANEPDEPMYPLTVVYQGPNGKVWTRRADDWHRSMTQEGTTKMTEPPEVGSVTETTGSRPLPDRRARRWVSEFWADRMRSGNAPDLPESIAIETFQAETERLAARLAPKPERLF